MIAQSGSYRIAPYIQAIKKMGLEVLIASRGEFSLITEVHAGLHIDPDDPESALTIILDEAARNPFAGILGCDDSTVELAATAAETLGLPHNSPDAARLSRRKDLARAHLMLANCPVPIHCLVDVCSPLDKQMKGLPYPCVLKPLNLSASRGVIRVNNPAEFLAACERIKPIIADAVDPFEQRYVLAEKYIDGEEVAFEGFLQDGELHTLVIFDKPDPLIGPYFEETIYVTPSRLDERDQKRIKQRVSQACEAYGLTTGPVHAELRINDEDVWILEVASRTIGGDCARILDGNLDYALEELTISLAMGRSVEVEPMQGARGVMMIPIPGAGLLRRVGGLTEARQDERIERIDITVPYGHELVPLPEGNQYPGYIFASGETSDEVVEALRNAHDKLDFEIAPLWKVTTGNGQSV